MDIMFALKPTDQRDGKPNLTKQDQKLTLIEIISEEEFVCTIISEFVCTLISEKMSCINCNKK